MLNLNLETVEWAQLLTHLTVFVFSYDPQDQSKKDTEKLQKRKY